VALLTGGQSWLIQMSKFDVHVFGHLLFAAVLWKVFDDEITRQG